MARSVVPTSTRKRKLYWKHRRKLQELQKSLSHNSQWWKLDYTWLIFDLPSKATPKRFFINSYDHHSPTQTPAIQTTPPQIKKNSNSTRTGIRTWKENYQNRL